MSAARAKYFSNQTFKPDSAQDERLASCLILRLVVDFCLIMAEIHLTPETRSTKQFYEEIDFEARQLHWAASASGVNVIRCNTDVCDSVLTNGVGEKASSSRRKIKTNDITSHILLWKYKN